jgi:hypothetical protein
MVAHVWANQSQEHAKSGHGNFFFNGRNLWSYGSHFLVGRIMPDGVALLNYDSYSTTTEKHKSYAYRAVKGAHFSIPGLTRLDQTGALNIGAKASKATRASTIKCTRAHILAHAGKISDDSALYLLRHAGERAPVKVLKRLQDEATRKAKRAVDDQAKAERKANLKRGAGVTVEKTRAVLSQARDWDLPRNIKKLFHAHKALKAAKREKQARVVWESLKLCWAELKRRADNAQIIAANKRAKIALNDVRDGLESIKASATTGEMMDSRSVRNLISELALVITSAPRLEKRPAIVALRDGLAQASPMIHAIEQEQEERKNAEELAAWIAGGGSKRPSFGYRLEKTYLRAVNVERDSAGAVTGGELQTSKGADVPLTHAIKAFRFLKLCRERGKGWTHNGHSIRVGHFTVDSIQPDGSFKAGCHNISWDEVARVTRELGVFDLAPADSALESTQHAA